MPGRKGKKKRKLKGVVRNPDGTFKRFEGGQDARETGYTHHGTMTHIGKTFKKQRGRKAKVGDVHRTKKLDGHYHANAPWYVMTPHGWRKTSFTKKPTRAQVKRVCEKSRRGR